jgi:hypothetical protein
MAATPSLPQELEPMKSAHPTGFRPGLKNNGSAANAEEKKPRVLIEFEIAKNLMAGSNTGLGEVLVYGAPDEQTELRV